MDSFYLRMLLTRKSDPRFYFQSAYDLKVAEDRVRSELTEKYEMEIQRLKDEHEKELKSAKSQKWVSWAKAIALLRSSRAL